MTTIQTHAVPPLTPRRPRRLARWSWFLLLCLFLLAPALPALADNGPASRDPAEGHRELDRIEKTLKAEEAEAALLRDWQKRINEFKATATECIAAQEQALIKAESDLVTLGQPVSGEAPDVAKKRSELSKHKAGLEKQLGSCRLLLLRSEDALQQVTAQHQQILALQLLARGPTFFQLVEENWNQPGVWFNVAAGFLREESGLGELSMAELAGLGLALALGLTLGLWQRRRLLGWEQRHAIYDNFSSRLAHGLVTVYRRYAPPLFASLAAALFFYALTRDISPVPFVSVVAYGLPLYFLLVTLIHLFLAPCPPAQPLLAVPEAVARALARRLTMLVLLLFLGYLLFTTLLAQSLPQPILLLARGVYGGFLIPYLIWAAWLFGRLTRENKSLALRTVITVVLIGALVAEWLGYRNLSSSVFKISIGTLIAFGALLLVSTLLRELFDGLDQGRHRWHLRLRRSLGLQPGQQVPGLAWLRVTTTLVLWSVFALAVLRVWGLSDTGLQLVTDFVFNGFTIGSLKVIPARILAAVLVFAVILMLSGSFKKLLEQRWLTKTRMERGAREAMGTVSGYVGVAVALLIGLSVAGMEFGNLAIIAGALSVGIGFGLQNVVNNFVSGLILLFERPIKTGDWIVVGETEGYVKKISIRSTQIQTFDRADVIVPNSELISGQVTNWMLHDPRGRARIKVGVAYGIDTLKVRDLLLEIVRAHPMVVKDGSSPDPTVLFIGFGDSALDFEVRAHVYNIDQRMSVISDLNFAIEAAFREHNIEIPFPQRDLHLRSWPAELAPQPKPEARDGTQLDGSVPN